jgi:hypothetical protein
LLSAALETGAGASPFLMILRPQAVRAVAAIKIAHTSAIAFFIIKTSLYYFLIPK